MVFTLCYKMLIIMDFKVKCIKDYITDKGEHLFKKDNIYLMKISDISEVKIFYNKNNGTKFIGGLTEYFTNIL